MKIILYSILLLISAITACKKFVQVDPPANRIVSTTAFSDDKTATATVNGMYARLLANTLYFGSHGFTLFTGLSSDELLNTAASTSYDPFATNALLSSTNNVNSIWASGYQLLFHANSCIEGLSTATTLTDSLRRQLLGEAKFLRAWYNFYFYNLFGDVPLVLSTDYAHNATLPRTEVALVRDQVKNDLLDALQLLSVNYPAAGRSRINQYCAKALLARVYLYEKNWAAAETMATSVINSGNYSLSTLANTFLATSNETIWQLSATGLSYNSYEGTVFIPTSATVVPTFQISTSLLASFEPGDNRKTSWLNKNTVGTQTFYYPYKYKVRTGATITENSIYLRLAEQYLIRAEARNEQDNLPGAKSDLDVIRARAGLGSTTGVDKIALRSAIEQERRIELMVECGHRWLDLKRTGRAEAVLSILKSPNWQSTDVLYPIPKAQMDLNPFLTQNPGY